MNTELLRLRGEEAREFVNEIAHLRLKVFWEFPYLYEGTLDYEKDYLETYFKAKHSSILLIKNKDSVVGVTTGILASEEEESFRKPFEDFGLDPSEVFYFGESLLLPEFRGRGLGKTFFKEREDFARSLKNVNTLSFAAVVRDENHPLRPANYGPLDPFWNSQGFHPEPGLTTKYEWKDRGEEKPTLKTMQYWIKKI